MRKRKIKAVSISKLDEETRMRIREWRNQPFVSKMMFTQHNISIEEHRNYIESIIKCDNKDMFIFYIDEEPFMVFHYSIDENRLARSGSYLTDESYSDMGYGAIGKYIIGIIIFEIARAHKSCAEVLSKNKKAMRILAGTQEGILRDHVLIDGVYYDIHCFGTLESEWQNSKSKLEMKLFKFIDSDITFIV